MILPSLHQSQRLKISLGNPSSARTYFSMPSCSYPIRVFMLSILLVLGMGVVADYAFCAIAPLVTTLSPLTEGSRTPVRLATNQAGDMYVTDPRGGGILRYNSAGALQQTISITKNVTGIAVAQSGDLLVSQGTSVAVFDKTSGALKSQFGVFQMANGIAVDAGGAIYVADSINNCVQVFSSAYAPLSTGMAAAGKPLNSFGTTGQQIGQFMQPTGVSYERIANQIAVVDTLNGRIQFFSTTGVYQKTVGSFGSGPLTFTAPQAIAFEYTKDSSSLSRMYVVDAFQGNVQVIDAASGSFLSYIGGYGLANGKLVVPSDVLYDRFDSSNNRLVVSNGNGSLTIYGVDMTGGYCGPAHKGTFAVAPTTDLCSSGSPTNFSGTGPWNWSCAGTAGGTVASCSAGLQGAPVMYALNVTLSGNGTVTSNPGGIACSGGSCSAGFSQGSTVSLIPTPVAGSVFSSWSGDCSGPGSCVVNMVANHTVEAIFDLIPLARVNGAPYGTLSTAYAAVGMNGIIEAQSVDFVENLTLNNGVVFTLQGGYDPAYGGRNSATTLDGTLTIATGGLIADSLVIK
jgi:hypothetical protein